MAYKMKGSPMQRNFGISPTKDTGHGAAPGHTHEQLRELEPETGERMLKQGFTENIKPTKAKHWTPELTEMTEERTKLRGEATELKGKEAKREKKRGEGKKVFLGKIKTLRNKKKQAKNEAERKALQTQINKAMKEAGN